VDTVHVTLSSAVVFEITAEKFVGPVIDTLPLASAGVIVSAGSGLSGWAHPAANKTTATQLMIERIGPSRTSWMYRGSRLFHQ